MGGAKSETSSRSRNHRSAFVVALICSWIKGLSIRQWSPCLRPAPLNPSNSRGFPLGGAKSETSSRSRNHRSASVVVLPLSSLGPHLNGWLMSPQFIQAWIEATFGSTLSRKSKPTLARKSFFIMGPQWLVDESSIHTSLDRSYILAHTRSQIRAHTRSQIILHHIRSSRSAMHTRPSLANHFSSHQICSMIDYAYFPLRFELN